MRAQLPALYLFVIALAACNSGDSDSTDTDKADVVVQQAVRVSVAQVDSSRILAADTEPHNWMSHGRTYSEQRFSPLDSINDENAEKLGLAWYFDFPTDRGIEATPIVVDGVMYVTASWSRVFALDAATGKQLWEYDPHVPGDWAVNLCCDVVNRGVAVWKGRIYSGTLDGRLLALDAASGKLAWEVQTTPPDKPYSITGAPRIVKGKVLIGNGGAELGVRGFVSAYDADTGELTWRFYTVPGDPQKPFENPILAEAAKTWKGGKWWEIGGGGTVWDSMAYDAELDLLYIGVGNGSPWNRMIRSPGGGDNWFLSSIVALRPDTGDYVWHYQTTPGETWDYTATQHMILADLQIAGKARKVIMQAPKNGFFYVLDRATGEFLSAEKYTLATWATHIGADGRPVETAGARYTSGEITEVAPHAFGGHNWHPMSYSPETGLVYIPAQEALIAYSHDEDFQYRPGAWNTGVKMENAGLPDDEAIRKGFGQLVKGHISAWDPVAQKEKWRVQHSNMWNGGLLSTAGNLLFQGNADGEFVAYKADDGSRVWGFDAHTGIVAAPVTYAVAEQQFVAVSAGWGGGFALASGEMGSRSRGAVNRSRVLAYSLGGMLNLPDDTRPERAKPEPPELVASAEAVTEGYKLYMRNCHTCHGDRAISASSLPDLRYMSAQTHQLFKPIVLGGLKHEKGMVGFAANISEAGVESIHAYLIKRAHDVLSGQMDNLE